MKIITLTLNPAFDVHCVIENLQLYKENYGTRLSRQSGGKGINLSRALNSYGIENTAIIRLMVNTDANLDIMRFCVLIGKVNKLSIVPLRFSSAQLRMLIAGIIIANMLG